MVKRKREVHEDEDAFPRGRAGKAAAVAPEPAPEADAPEAEAAAAPTPSKPSRARVVDADDVVEVRRRAVSRLRGVDLPEGTLLIAAVREAFDDELVMNLPYNLVGYVSAEHAVDRSKSSEAQPLPKLTQLYKPGQLVVVVVIGNEPGDAQGKRQRLELSLRPALANAGLDAELAAPSMWLPAVVEEDEEHVVRLGFGPPGLMGVLKKKDMGELPFALCPGIILQVAVQAVSAGTLRCTLRATQSVITAPLKLEAVKAGFLVQARIEQIFASEQRPGAPHKGMVASLCGSLTGLVHTHHQALDSVLKNKQRVTARVLAVVPGPTVTLHLTLLPHLIDWASQADSLEAVPIGRRLDGEVIDYIPRFGCRLRAAPHDHADQEAAGAAAGAALTAFCPSGKIADGSEEPVADSVEAGVQAQCRVLCYNYLDAALVVTRRPADLREKCLVSVTELSPGQLVSGVVSRVAEFGIFVKLSEYVTGLVHMRQLTDVPLATVPKRFQIDAKIKCRVLRVFPEKRHVSLTAKKSLVKDDFQLVSFEQARRDLLVTGYISNVQSYGAIVSFYGDLFGLIPSEEMDADSAPALGMAVKCRIQRVNRKRRRLALSLNLEGGGDASAGAGGSIAGQLACSVRATATSPEGVFVRFRPKAASADGAASEWSRGFVPLAHLSDAALEACTVRHKELAALVGDRGAAEVAPEAEEKGVKLDVEGVVLARTHSSTRQTEEEGKPSGPPVALVSLKPSLHAAAKAGKFAANLEDLEVSHTYSGYVKEVRQFGGLISVGAWRLHGMVPKGRIADRLVEKPEEVLYPGQSVRVLISEIDRERKRFMADMRLDRAGRRETMVVRKEVGALVTMRVQAVHGLNVTCAAANDVRGHLHATHLLDLKGLPDGREPDKGPTPLEDIEKRGTLSARILRIPKRQARAEALEGTHIEHFELTCRKSLMKEDVPAENYEAAAVSWRSLKRGQLVVAAVTEVRKSEMWMEVGPNIRGRVAPLDASADLAVIQDLPEHFRVGQLFRARVLNVSRAHKRLDLSLQVDAGSSLSKGSRVLARLEKLQDVKGRGVAALFHLPGGMVGFVHVTELFDFWAPQPLRRLKPRTIHEVVVLEEAESTADGNSRLELSLRASLVVGKAIGPGEKRPLEAKELQTGQKVTGYVVNSGEKGVFVALSRTLVARIRLRNLSERIVARDAVAKIHPPGELIRDATIVDIDGAGRIELSLRQGNDSELLTLAQLSVGDVVSGRVKKVARYGVIVRLDGSHLDGLAHISEIADTASVSLDSYKVGDRVQRAKVLKIEGGKFWLSLKPSLFSGEDFEEDEADDMDDDDLPDLEEAVKADSKAAKEAAAPASEGAAPAAQRGKKRPPPASAGADPDADSDDEAPWAAAIARPGAHGGEAAFVFEDFKAAVPSSSEDEADRGDGDSDAADGRPKLSKRQRKAAKAADAEEVRRREAEQAEGRWANDPRSVEDFERLLLTEGDTSIVWIRYMAFHLKMSDLEKARSVAERAVKHVGFSEAQERLNVWVAFLNLECTFGTDETAAAVFKRAASHNDAKDMHLHLARIHQRNAKPQLATQAYELACKKFRESKSVWLAFLDFLYEQGDLEGARKLLPRALASLPRAKHPVVVSKAAIFEYTRGSTERGRNIFEGLLDSYPKRTDLWSVYIDAHIRAYTPPRLPSPDLAEIRSLFGRCCSLRLKAMKMRFFFKRWLDFEKRWGDEESQEKVRARARAFVESQAD